MKYIACIAPCEVVVNFGEGNFPVEALHDFLNNGELSAYCGCRDIPDGSILVVEIHHAVEYDDPEADEEQKDLMESEGFQWLLVDKICEHKIRYEHGEPIQFCNGKDGE